MYITVFSASLTAEELETVDYLNGFWETHPEEFPKSFDEFKEMLISYKEIAQESNQEVIDENNQK